MMRKLFILFLLYAIFLSNFASAATRLKIKSSADAYDHIGFVAGTGTEIQIFDNKIKVIPLELIKGHRDRYDLDLSDPSVKVYYFRTVGIGIRPVPHILGVKGIKVKLENLTNNELRIHWSESIVQVGKFGSMPFIKGMNFADAANPSKVPDTILPPKASNEIELYPSANVQRVYRVMDNQIEPISNDGTTKIVVNMKVEENGAKKSYFYVTPCIDFPADFIATYKAEPKGK